VTYLVVAAVVLGVNLMPAFGPPTWAVLVYFELTSDLDAVPLVLVGAVAAALGRFTLASAARRLRPRLSDHRRESLAAAEEALTGGRARGAVGLGLFALSPVPSAQLFVAAGLLTVPLVPLTLAFFAGRLLSYSLYVGGASLARDSLGDLVVRSLTSPVGIALQIAMLGGLVLLLRVDWAAHLRRHRGG
jgi:membrane protein YqaA with SNARE-associated domain